MEKTVINIGEDIVPIVLLLAVAVTYCMKYYFAWRTRQDLQTTIRSALERGQALTPDLLDRLGQPGRRRNIDLRRGIMGITIGVAFMGLSLIIDHANAVRPLLGIGLVSLLVGLAYVGLWRFDSSRS